MKMQEPSGRFSKESKLKVAARMVMLSCNQSHISGV